jgi:hypothetical protein
MQNFKPDHTGTRGVPRHDWHTMRLAQRHGISNGSALRRHADDAHGGEVSADCAACKELQERARFLADAT